MSLLLEEKGQLALGSNQAVESSRLIDGRWSIARRVAFRFGLAYLVVATFPGPIDPLSFERKWDGLWKVPVEVLAQRFFGHGAGRLGSMSDGLAGWLLTACFVGLAALVAAVWSILDRRTEAYPRLADLAVGYLRYWLAAIVVHYGLIKVFCGQFPRPDVAWLIQPLGQQPPMVLLWNAMGASPLYQAFGGAIEVLGALLLFFRRTALLGALITFGAMANVLALNVGYDIFVKNLTLHLLLAALVVVAVHRARLVAFFLRDRPAPPPPARIPFSSLRLDLGFRVAGYALAAWLVGSAVFETRALAARNTAAEPAWSGLYEVTAFSVDGEELAPRFGDHARWRRVVVYPHALIVELGDDAREIWLAERDEQKKTWSVQLDDRTSFEEPLEKEPTVLHYEERDGEVLALDGMLGPRRVSATLHRVRPTFRLERPTGHWIDDGTGQR